MRTDAKKLEENRLSGLTLENYPFVHERHRIFPEVFEDRGHRKIMDISAGIGVVAKLVTDRYPCDMHCNEVDETCLRELKKLNVRLTSFDLDTGKPLPIETKTYDAIICLATIEHLINVDEFINDLNRILKDDGRLYLSTPNAAGFLSTITLLRGRTFNNPLDERSRYEFYAHVRYFTYRTLIEYMEHFGFIPDTVYLPLPKQSTRFQRIRNRSRLLSSLIRSACRFLYMTSARWHQEPVVCFAKQETGVKKKKRVL